MYKYKAKAVRIVDGDTIDCLVDLGFDVWRKVRIRMRGINTPESRTKDPIEKKAGLAAKDRLVELLEASDLEFTLQSYGVGKYGRCLGEIFVEGAEVSVNQQLVNEGHAEEYWGGKR